MLKKKKRQQLCTFDVAFYLIQDVIKRMVGVTVRDIAEEMEQLCDLGWVV